MTRQTGVVLLLAALFANAISPALVAGVPSKKAFYRGGTLSVPDEDTVGWVSLTDAEWFVFDFGDGDVRVRYADVNSLEYGQKSARRLGLAITLSPLFLLSRKRRHFLTIHYRDGNGAQHAAVFELGKKILRPTLRGLEARTGKQIEYEDEEARRSSQW